MKAWIFLWLLVVYLQGTSAKLHSLKNLFTASSEVTNVPEFVITALIDDVQFLHYDSNIRRVVPRQDWVDKATELRDDYWDWQTDIAVNNHQSFKALIGNFMEDLNETGGVFQQMLGCEWDDETDEAVSGFWQIGYNGEDFISFDLKTETWIAAKPQAVLTKQRWDEDKAYIERRKYSLTQFCPDWAKKYVNYGKSSLMRTDLPSVSLLQKTSSSPVRCFATGFYPKVASLVWRRDGVEIHEDVEPGEILPNQDGTFQMSVDLDVSSVRAEDWGRLDCVFQLSGVKDHMVTRLDRAVIKTNEENPSHTGIIIVAAVVLVVAIAVTGFILYGWKRWKSVKNRKIEFEARLMNQQHERETATTQ